MKHLLLGISILLLSVSSIFANGYKVGDEAINFNLKDVNGQMVSMDDADSQGYIVIFTCNTCPYSKLYEDRIIALHEKYSAQGYPVIAINSNDAQRSPGDSFDKMQAVASAKNYPFPYVLDETQEIARAYGATKTPEVYLLKKDGEKLIVAYQGAIDNNHRNPQDVSEAYVSNAIDAVLKGAAAPTESARAIGCGIKWKRTE